MTSGTPSDLSPNARREPGVAALQRALAGESALTLGRAGRAVEVALATLAGAAPPAREALQYACAEAVWRYFVQREACGMLRHEPVIEALGIPPEVLAKVGAARPPVGAIGGT